MRLRISIVQLALKGLEAIPQKALKLQLVRMYLIKKNFGITVQLLMIHLIKKFQKI